MPGPEQPVTRVLIVEDEELLVLELQDRLTRLGYDVVGSARNGSKAIMLARALEPGLILMDVRLAGPMDGIDAAAAIHTAADVPIVFVTAHSDNRTLGRALSEAAPYGYLVKPFGPDALRATLALALRKYRLEQDLRRTNQALQRNATALEEFTAAASHDLRSPVATILGVLDLLKDDRSVTSEQAELLTALSDTASRMQTLLDGLLGLAQLRPPSIVPVELESLLRQVTSDLRARIDQSSAVVEIEGLPTVYGDRAQLYRLFLNLLDNAIKYRRADAAPHVALRGHANGDTAMIEVRDNGIGLPAGHESRLFRPFQRLGRDNQYEGTGFGLAACAKIVRDHRGSLTARGAHPFGTVFTIELPASAPRSESV